MIIQFQSSLRLLAVWVNRLLAVVTALILGLSLPAHALKSDRDQPATLDADQFDLDFQTGIRTYRGNVIYKQGSIRLTADEIVTYFDDDGGLEKAIATGKPAQFKQRPDDSDDDVVGVGARIELNEVSRIVTLETGAKVTQGKNTITGRKITYNLDTEKARVESGPRKATSSKKADAKPESDSEADTKDGSESEVEGTPSRPRLIIKPRS